MRQNHELRAILAGVLVPIVLAAGTALVLAAGGSLDTGFGNGGIAVIGTGGTATFNGLAVQSDGMTLECGSSDTGSVNELGARILEWQVRRLDGLGALDLGFGTFGLVRLFGDTSGAGFANSPRGLVVDGEGRAVVAGTSLIKTVTVMGTGKKKKTTFSWVQYATLVRLHPNGTLDTTFGADGVVRTSIPGASHAAAEALVIQPDGKVAIVGVGIFEDPAKLGGIRHDPFVARYLEDGSLDATFGAGGITMDPRPTTYATRATVRGIALQSTGRIVVAEGAFPSSWIIARFGANGAPDTGFPTISTADTINGLSVDRFDRIVGTGQTPSIESAYDMRIARYSADGSADSSFGSGGVVTIDSSVRELAQSRAVFQAVDDAIVFGARAELATNPVTFFVTAIRLTDAGVLDATFGAGGWGAPIPGAAGGYAVALAPDGRILLGGNMFTSTSSVFVARYDAD